MSVDKAIEQIDFILNILDEADKKQTGGQCCHDDSTHKHQHDHGHKHHHGQHHEHHEHHHEHGHGHDHSHDHAHEHQETVKKANLNIPTNIKYFNSPSDLKTGMNVRITPDPKLLGQYWDECGLGPMDELESLCNVIGSVQEIEENDNTVELRWENYDTAWIPIKACYDAGDSKPTLPGVHTSWLSPENVENQGSENKEDNNEQSQGQGQGHGQDQDQDQGHGQSQQQEEEVDESQIKYFESVEDEYIKPGAIVRVTKSIELLEKYWKQSELGPNDTKYAYLGVYGAIQQVEEDDDTIEVRWANYDTVWIPVQATSAAPGKKETLPTESVSHVEDE